jgi:hypothetical protein
MYPAINVGTSGIVIVTIIFGITTIATMLIIVVSAIYGIGFFPLKRYEKYSHVLAGLIIAISGLSVQFLGL